MQFRHHAHFGRSILAASVTGVAALVAATTAATATATAGAPVAAAAAPLSIHQVWATGNLPDLNNPIALSSPGLATLDGGGPAAVVGDRAGHVYALHISNGSEVGGWPVTTPGGIPVDSPPSASGANVFVGVGNAATSQCDSVNGHTYCGGYESFAANGAVRWYRTVPAEPLPGALPAGVRAGLTVGTIQGTPAVVAGTMYQEMYALNAGNGATLVGWPFFTADSVFTTAALGDIYRNGQTEIVEGGGSTAGVALGHTYTNGGHVRVLNQTGQLLCDYDTNQVVESSPAIGQIFAGGGVGMVLGTGMYYPGASQSNQLLAFGPHCNPVWSHTLDGDTSSSPALADALGNGQLQIAEGTNNGHGGGGVWLLNGATGATLWHVPAIGEVIGSVVTADLGTGYQDILVPTTQGLEVLDGRTGALLNTVDQGQLLLQNSPLVTRDANGSVGITLAGYTGANVGMVAHFEVSSSPGSRVGEAGSWPMFHHDPQLTGNAGIAPPVVGVPCRAPAGGPRGYYLAASDGGVFPFGNLAFCGSTGNITLNKPIVGMAATRDGGGYWLVASDGGIFPFGDARFYGSLGNIRLNQPIVGMAPTPDGKGYWLVASDGGVFHFGDAHFYGSLGNIHLNRPIVAMAATSNGGGYWMAASDGGVFHFGNARFYGSLGNIRLNKPVVGMAATANSGGYWMAASDGGIFHFGNAAFHGSLGNIRLNKPIVALAADGTTGGYWQVASDGGVFNFAAPFYGSTGNIRLNKPVVGMAGL